MLRPSTARYRRPRRRSTAIRRVRTRGTVTYSGRSGINNVNLSNSSSSAAVLSRFDRISTSDRETDGQTPSHRIYRTVRASIGSRSGIRIRIFRWYHGYDVPASTSNYS